MTSHAMSDAMRAAGAIYVGIMVANVPLPRRLRLQERLAGVPGFVRQIFYVHWIYIVLLLGMFAALCFGFASDLSGATALGRFLSAVMAAFWLLRMGLQVFYYDRQLRRENRGLDLLYMTALAFLIVIFGAAALRPVR
jgi:hypothetical protein